jgi:hypothetical protein
MPFVIPEVNVFDRSRSAGVNRITSNSTPTDLNLANYIEWLEDELAIAKAEHLSRTGEPWPETNSRT